MNTYHILEELRVSPHRICQNFIWLFDWNDCFLCSLEDSIWSLSHYAVKTWILLWLIHKDLTVSSFDAVLSWDKAAASRSKSIVLIFMYAVGIVIFFCRGRGLFGVK